MVNAVVYHSRSEVERELDRILTRLGRTADELREADRRFDLTADEQADLMRVESLEWLLTAAVDREFRQGAVQHRSEQLERYRDSLGIDISQGRMSARDGGRFDPVEFHGAPGHKPRPPEAAQYP